jgi:hypothetical protein
MSWFRLAHRGAAYEFGRRLWRWFAAVEVIRWFLRRVLPTLTVLTVLAVAVWFAVRTSAWWWPRLTALAAFAAILTAALWLAHRYRWEIRAGLPRTAIAAAVVALAGLLGTAVYWLR